MTKLAELEEQLVKAKGDPERYAQVTEEIRSAGLTHVADALDRIARR